MIEEVKYRWWELECKLHKFIKRLKFAFGAYDQNMIMVSEFTQQALEEGDPSGTVHIGCIDEALGLYDKGITQFEKRTPDSCVASIGYAPSKEMWYGWSHRAICGFGVGSEITHEDIGYAEFYKYVYGFDLEIKETGSQAFIIFTIATLDDAKRMAEIFAADVS